jgi:hypothetical protein
MTQSDLLSTEEVDLLALYIGSTWNSICGNSMDLDFFAWGWVVINTSLGPLRITLESRELDFEGDWDDYSQFSIEQSDLGAREAAAKGEIFYFERDQEISEVWLVRDTMTNHRKDGQTIRYVSDVAIVFKFGSSWITISKNYHRSEAIDVIRGSNASPIQVTNLESRWESDLFNDYEHEREWIEIKRLAQ